MVELRWARRAQADLDGIFRYHSPDDPALALDLIERIVGAGRRLAEMPEVAPLTARGRRKWRVPKTSYLLFYRIEADHIRILRVLHGARDLVARQ